MIKRSALVGYSAKQMYQLVNDIESYPEFVPFCTGAETIEQNEQQKSARLILSKSGFAKSFSTKNRLIPFQKIQIQLIDGPFKHLSGEWHFIALSDNACKVELSLDYEFSNKLTSLAFAKIFNQLVQSMITAFTDRAKVIYE